MGLVISAGRWLAVDNLHHRTGMARTEFDFSKLTANLDAFRIAVEHYYRYYQFYANMSVAVVVYAICHAHAVGDWTIANWLELAGLEVVLLVNSRESLKRYYQRGAQILQRESLIT
jgi:trans-aconitate methyltransferase